MGLNRTTLKLIIRNIGALRRRESVLTLGTQDIYATYKELTSAFEELKQEYVEVSSADRTLSSSYIFRVSPLATNRGNVDASVFFRMLGFSRYAQLDVLELDGSPSIRHDLNEPIPSEWERTYDLVVDGGTVEHIFDIKVALSNTARFVRNGGMVIHNSPVLFYDHGFWGINPTALVEFYTANGFRIVETTCFAYDRYRAYARMWCFPYSGQSLPPSWFLGRFDLGVFVCAQRIDEPSGNPLVVPMQGVYARMQAEDSPAVVRPLSNLEILYAKALASLPRAVHALLGKGKRDFTRWRWFRRVRYRF